MTSHEKAVNAINARLARLQSNLRDAKDDGAQQFLFQSLVVTIGVAEALTDYVKSVGGYAQRRHAELKRTNDTLGAQHADLLGSGKELLEKLKANPTDAAVRKQIEAAQRAMAAVQKAVRRGANALQRDTAPGLAMIDQMAVNLRQLSEAEETPVLKRVLKTMVGQVRQLYAAQPGLAKGLIAAEAWEKSAVTELEQAAAFSDAYARAGYQAMLALELMALALAENPPATAAETARRGSEAAGARLKRISARLTGA